METGLPSRARIVLASVLILFEVFGGVRFLALPVTFSCRHRDRLASGHRVLVNFLRAVAEACSPQRLREENAA